MEGKQWEKERKKEIHFPSSDIFPTTSEKNRRNAIQHFLFSIFIEKVV